ncbi:MAG: transposase [Candidatus Shapirobacteria bacterium]
MGRPQRTDIGGYVYHILNRTNARTVIFNKDKEYQDFEQILFEAVEKFKIRLVAYTLMPNHFHLVLYPKYDGEIKKFMHWLTLTHTQRWHARTKTIGYGHLYQGRYKSFLVETDSYLWILLSYVERNPLRAKLVKSLKNWKWSSYYKRSRGTLLQKKLLATNSIAWSADYEKSLTLIEEKNNLKTIRNSVNRGKPYGSDNWTEKVLKKFGLEITGRRRGRPKKGS